MRPPCEIIVRYILPAFRSLIAKELLEKYDLTQAAVAEKLGTSQPAISYYLYSKRGKKHLKQLEAIPAVQSVASKVAKEIVDEGLSPIDAISRFCKLCMELRTQDIVCKMHKDYISLPEACKGCLRVFDTS